MRQRVRRSRSASPAERDTTRPDASASGRAAERDRERTGDRGSRSAQGLRRARAPRAPRSPGTTPRGFPSPRVPKRSRARRRAVAHAALARPTCRSNAPPRRRRALPPGRTTFRVHLSTSRRRRPTSPATPHRGTRGPTCGDSSRIIDESKCSARKRATAAWSPFSRTRTVSVVGESRGGQAARPAAPFPRP
jgi:hypothetical protein